MAKKENEENKDVNQESEEDFGLPDLEFEELDDIDEEEDSGEEDLQDEIAEIVGDASDDDNVMEDIGIGNMEEEIQISEEADALGDIGTPDTMSASEDDELDEVDKFISEITADDEGSDDSSSDIGDFGSDDGDSDEIEEPDSGGMFARDDSGDSGGDDYSSTYDYEEEDGGTSPAFTRIIVFGLVSAVILAFAFLYFSEGPDETAMAETPEPVAEQPEPVVEEEPVQEEAPVQEEEPAPVVEEPVSSGTPGEVTTITASAGRYYVVVASFIDDDLANDHGQQLASAGASVKIISPFNNKKYYRVSVADFSSRQDAVNATEQLKSQFGEDIWALKY